MLAELGISVGKPKLDLAAMMQNKDEIVKGLTGGIDMLFRKNKVGRVTGTARITSPGEVEVTAADGATSRHQAERNSHRQRVEPGVMLGVTIDEDRIVSSTVPCALARCQNGWW